MFTIGQLIDAVYALKKEDRDATDAEACEAIYESHEVSSSQMNELYRHFDLSYNRVTGDWEEGGDEVTDEFPEPGELREWA